VNGLSTLLMCLAYLAFMGFGLNFLLTALFPSSRKKDWRHRKLYRIVNFLPGVLDSFLEQFGFVNFGIVKRRPNTGDLFDEKSAVTLYYIFAATFLLLGIGGLALIVLRSVS